MNGAEIKHALPFTTTLYHTQLLVVKTPPCQKHNVPVTPTKAAHIVTLVNEGHSNHKVAETNGIDHTTVSRTYQKFAGKENFYARIKGRGQKTQAGCRRLCFCRQKDIAMSAPPQLTLSTTFSRMCQRGQCNKH